MTSLSDQLQRLRAPQSSAHFKDDRQRASLLFDRKDAAGYGEEQLLALGQRGFEELLCLDAGFLEFRDTLFGHLSADVERSVLTKQDNDKLARTISSFLYRLTPYYLLTGAHQALEWLIYKFHIHEYDKDDVLYSALAHHDSGLFVKLVRVCCWSGSEEPKEASTSTWGWLRRSVQRHGQPLARRQLINHCSANLNFLQALCEAMLRARELLEDADSRSLRMVYSFYVSVVCGVLGECDGSIGDAIVGRLMPYIGQGLKSKEGPFVVSSCMIVCQLASKVVLTEQAASALLSQSILAILDEDTANTALPTAAVLCRTQPGAQLPSKSMKKIITRLDRANGWSVLGKLSERLSLDVDKLVDVLLRGLVDKMAKVKLKEDGDGDNDKNMALYEAAAKKLLESVRLEPGVAVATLKRIFGHCAEERAQQAKKKLEDAFRPLAISIGEQLRQLAIVSNQRRKEGTTTAEEVTTRKRRKRPAVQDSNMEQAEEPGETEQGVVPAIEQLEFQDVTADTFRHLPPSKQQAKFEQLLNSLRSSERAKALGAKQALRRVTIPGSLYAKALQSIMQDAAGEEVEKEAAAAPAPPTTTPDKGAKKKRKTMGSSSTTGGWTRGLIDVLETYLDKDCDDHDHQQRRGGGQALAQPVFAALKRCMSSTVTTTSRDHDATPYAAQLCMAVLVEIFKGPDAKAADFDVDMVVQCAQASQSDQPRLQQHAFQLLSVAARLFKEDLLVRVMPIFSFMGHGLLRQDDSYTFHLIDRVLENVVPPMLASSKDPLSTLVKVFGDLVVSVPHIPEHRRLVVLKKVVDVAASTDNIHCRGCLWVLVGTAIEYHVTHWDKALEEQQEAMGPFMDFIVRLCCEFGSQDQLECLINLLRYTTDQLPDRRDQKRDPVVSGPSPAGRLPTIFDPLSHTNKHLRHFKYEAASLAAHLLAAPSFLAKLVEATSDQEGSSATTTIPDHLVQQFQRLLEILLGQYERASRQMQQGKDMAAGGRYWSAFRSTVKRSIQQILALLPGSVTLSVVGGVLASDSKPMKLHATELLNAKLLQHPTPFTRDHVNQLVSLCGALTDLLDPAPAEDHQTVVLCQGVLYTIKLLARTVAPFQPETLKPTIDRVSDILGSWRTCTDPMYLSNAALCLAELVQCVGLVAVPAMPRFVRDMITMLEKQQQTPGGAAAEDDLLLTSGLTAVHKVLDKLAAFFGPYLPKFLEVMGKISAKKGGVSAAAIGGGKFKTQILHRIDAIRKILASSSSSAMPARILLPAVEKVFQELSTSQNPAELSFTFLVLNDHIKDQTSSQLSASLAQLTKLFLSFFDLRYLSSSNRISEKQQMDEEEEAEMEASEDQCLVGFVSLAMKVSEKEFRPILFKVVDWASSSNSTDRLITLFRLTSKLYDTFRGLFNLFAGQIIKLSCEILVQAKDFTGDGRRAEAKSVKLYGYVFDTISKCCQFDSNGFVTRDRFDSMIGPLLEQLDIWAGKSQAVLLDSLSGCISYACLAVKEDAPRKAATYQVLLKTRHNDPKVRMAALELLNDLFSRLGSEAAILVEESVPFLAELLEDENEDVAGKCEKVIRNLESIVGDSLRQYF